MKKINFNEHEDISLFLPDNREAFRIPIELAYSWSKIIEYQPVLDSTIDAITKWYWKMQNLKAIIDNYPNLWNHLLDYIAECYLTDFASSNYYETNKQSLIFDLNNNSSTLFDKAFDDIKNVWGGLSIDQITNQAYRAIRKESRGRITGIGFGLKGGIGSAIGAGLGNMASGLAHSAINTVGNAMDSISTNKQMNDFYKQESTLENIIEDWERIFWLMYRGHIESFNDLCVVKGTPQILNYYQMREKKEKAITIYNNFVDRSTNKTHGGLAEISLQCLDEFPFESEYWKKYLRYLLPLCSDTKEIFPCIINFSKKIDEYVPSFSSEIASFLVETMLTVFVDSKNANRETSATKGIVDYFKEHKNDEVFTENLANALINKFHEKAFRAKEFAFTNGLLDLFDNPLFPPVFKINDTRN
jgi:hypothetical protein